LGKLYAFFRKEGVRQMMVPRELLQNGTPPTGALGLKEESRSETTELGLTVWRGLAVVETYEADAGLAKKRKRKGTSKTG
jgi:hypothetical protein